MSLYDSARPVVPVTFREIMERKLRAAEEMLGMPPAEIPFGLPQLGHMVNVLEGRCIISLTAKREPCPLCHRPMQAAMRPVVEAPFIILKCWNAECECNKNRVYKEEKREVRDTYGT